MTRNFLNLVKSIKSDSATDKKLEELLKKHEEELEQLRQQLREEIEKNSALQKRLTGTEELLDRISENTAQAFWIIDTSMDNVLYVSSGYEKIWESKASWLYQKPESWLDKVHKEDRKSVRDSLSKPHEERLTEQYRIVCSDGTVRWISDRSTPVFNDRGEIRQYLRIAEDITDHKQAIEALVNERNYSEEIINSLPGVFYLFNQYGKFLRWNKNLEKITEYSTDEIGEMRPIDFFHTPDRELIAKRIAKVFENGEADAEANVVSKSGSLMPFYFTGKHVLLDGESCVIGMGIDIRERRSLEEQLRQVQKLDSIGQLSAGIAHDYNNLLTIQQGYSSILLSDPELPERFIKPVRKIVDAAERAAALTRHLLTFSRRQSIQIKNISLNEVISNLSNLLTRLLGEDIELVLELKQEFTIQADSNMIEQVVMNLASNARDAMPDGGRFTMSAESIEIDEVSASSNTEAQTGKYIRLDITDTGTGMPKEIIDHIFDPFFTTKEVGKGTGLGLSSVHGIIKQHRGWIETYSESGKGTTFSIFIPAAEHQEQHCESRESSDKIASGTETILLVEDETDVLDMATAALESQGYRVISARTGVIAEAIWQDNADKIDLLFTDIVMPDGISGSSLAEKLREHRPELKVVFTSGYSKETSVQELVNSGKAFFLQKPYTVQKLTQIIRQCLDS